MKAAELRDMDRTALEGKLIELRREQFNLRMQRASGQETQQQDFRRVRKDIARIKTVLNEQASAASDA